MRTVNIMGQAILTIKRFVLSLCITIVWRLNLGLVGYKYESLGILYESSYEGKAFHLDTFDHELIVFLNHASAMPR